MWEIKARESKLESKETAALKDQLNRLKTNTEFLCSSLALPDTTELDHAITGFEADLDKICERKSKELANKAKVKWFNKGEKSKKYFLNIIKKRQMQTAITSKLLHYVCQSISKSKFRSAFS